MGLFGSSDKSKPRGGTTIIAEGTSVTGDLDVAGNLHIDGHVEGRILSENDVSVGASGSFEGDIRAARIVVSGMVRGRVECERLEIVETGGVFGDVSSNAFVIEPGGQFLGESRTTDEEAVKALSYIREPEASTARSTESAPDAKTDNGKTDEDIDTDAGSDSGLRQVAGVAKILN